MKFQFLAQGMVAAFALSIPLSLTTAVQALPTVGGNSSGSSSTPASSPSGSTTFRCVQSGGGFATVAVTASGKQTRPLITWNSNAFSAGGFTPEQRCLEVSDKLTRAVAQNGGKLTSLLLTTGNRGGSNVICYVNNAGSGCNANNHLMNIAPGVYRNPGDALADLLKSASNPFVTGAPLRNTANRTYVDFGAAVQEVVDEVESSGNSGSFPEPISPQEPVTPSGGGDEPI